MKALLTSITAVAAFMLFSCNQAPEAAVAKPTSWVFVVSPQTTLHDIDSVAMAWKKDSIDLKFTQLEYTDDGKLSIVSGSVNFMKKGDLPSAKFVQDSISKKSLEIKLDNRPSVSISDK